MWNSNDLREDLILLNEMQKKENDINMREYYSLIIGAIYDNIVDVGMEGVQQEQIMKKQ